MQPENEQLLSFEKQVRRVNNTVTRPAGAWSGNIQQFLEHLSESGLPVEHMRGIDGDCEVYDFIEAETIHPYAWSDDALWGVGSLLRKLHCAGERFASREPDAYRPWCLREIGSEQRVWCHGDVAPWNMLTRQGKPFALVDWEFSGPLDPFVEFARVCWLFTQLHDDDIAAMYSLPPLNKRAEQLRLLCDAYGLEPSQRKRLVEQIIEVVICETAHEAIDRQVTQSDSGLLWGFAWRTRSLYWIWRHRAYLGGRL